MSDRSHPHLHAVPSRDAAHPPDASGSTLIEQTAHALGGDRREAQLLGSVAAAGDAAQLQFKRLAIEAPAHQLVWGDQFPVEAFYPSPPAPAEARTVMLATITLVLGWKKTNEHLGPDGKITEAAMRRLGEAGYWGLLIPKEYGGTGCPFGAFAKFVTELATIDPTIAGLSSVHGCIGAVDPLVTFGTEEQKRKFLPLLASGEFTSAFALTEPGAGSDLTAVRCSAVRDGDDYVLNGRKVFITNAWYHRIVGLVVVLNPDRAANAKPKHGVIIVQLPDDAPADGSFRIHQYGLHALRSARNVGLEFVNFRVPAENILMAPDRTGQLSISEGLQIAYHGLNRGRVALLANAGGQCRALLASLDPWGKFRKTFGHPIETREHVQAFYARIAALIVIIEALTEHTARLLEEGHRGELECTFAKRFGSEAAFEAALRLAAKIHGGRSLREGHIIGDNLGEYLAPLIYEGEGAMLAMAWLNALLKEVGEKYFGPLNQAIIALKKERGEHFRFSPMNPAHAWAVRRPLFGIMGFAVARAAHVAGRTVKEALGLDKSSQVSGRLGKFHRRSVTGLLRFGLKCLGYMLIHQQHLPNRQQRLEALTDEAQTRYLIVTTARWGARQADDVLKKVAELACEQLQREVSWLRPAPSDAAFRRAAKVGEMVRDGKFPLIEAIEVPAIIEPYGVPAATSAAA